MDDGGVRHHPDHPTTYTGLLDPNALSPRGGALGGQTFTCYKFGNRAISNDYRIPRCLSLIVLKGDEELDRIVAGTGYNAIKGLMNTALTAATS